MQKILPKINSKSSITFLTRQTIKKETTEITSLKNVSSKEKALN